MGRRGIGLVAALGVCLAASFAVGHPSMLGLIDWRSSGARLGEASIVDAEATGFTPSRTGNILTLSLASSVSLLGQTIGDSPSEIAGGSAAPSSDCEPGQVYIHRDAALTGDDRLERVYICIETDTWAQIGSVLLTGRSGGQTIYGDTAADGSLNLASTSNADAGTINLGSGFTQTDSSETVVAVSPSVGALPDTGTFVGLGISPTASFSSGTFQATLSGVRVSPTYTVSAGAPLLRSALFGGSGTFVTTGSSVSLPLMDFANDASTHQTSNVTATTSGLISYRSAPVILTSGGSGAGTLTEFNGFFSGGVVQTNTAGGSQTVTTWRGLRVANPTTTGAGTETITTLAGVDIAALTAGGTNIAVRSDGAATSRLEGGLTLGDDGQAPETALHLDTTASIVAAITIDEESAAPSDPASGTQARIFIKGDRLVIQFNDGGTVRYKCLTLSGTGTTWGHSTTEASCS